jgi:hypothetical protein
MAVFKVIDAMDAPHGGRMLRLKLIDGMAPSLGEIKGGTFDTKSPEGESGGRIRVDSFAVFGGKASNARFEKTGRVDVQVLGVDRSPSEIGLRWELRGP